jgi:hypothetical protein
MVAVEEGAHYHAQDSRATMSDEYGHLRRDADATATPSVSHPIAFVFLGVTSTDRRVLEALRVAAR